MTRLAHKATDDLPDEAWRVMHGGFRAKKTARAIVRDLADIGIEVAERTVARRAREWRSEQRRREAARDQVQDLVAAMKEQNLNAAEMLQALAVDALIQDPDAWSGADPLAVQRQNLLAQQVRLKEREIAVRERSVAAVEKRLELVEAREERAKAVASDDSEKLTPDERLSEIQAIYGIKGANG
jgi:hypothetical protein